MDTTVVSIRLVYSYHCCRCKVSLLRHSGQNQVSVLKHCIRYKVLHHSRLIADDCNQHRIDVLTQPAISVRLVNSPPP